MKFGFAGAGLFLLLHNAWGKVTFLEGRFNATKDDVWSRAEISKDVQGLFNAQSKEEAIRFYQNGTNTQDQNGTLHSLHDLSRAGEKAMLSDPEYVRFWHALDHTQGSTSIFATDNYADVFTRHYIDKEDFHIAATGSVVLGVWMFIIHELRYSHRTCMEGDQRASDGLLSKLEYAAAYYFGANQTTAGTDGFSMYSVAQDAGKAFDTLHESGEALTNKRIVSAFREAQSLLKNPESETGSCLKLRGVVDKIITLMTIPLLQNLIKHLYKEEHEKIRQYALAVVPLLEGCSPEDFHTLFDVLILDYDKFNFGDHFDHVLDTLEFNYPCLGIRCEDIGSYGDSYSSCEDRKASVPIAGYTPLEDVRHRARLDLDILQIRIFLESERYDLAKDLYFHGRNSQDSDGGYHTLHKMATSTTKKDVPSFHNYQEYFNHDDYAHIMFIQAMELEGKFQDASPEQVTEVATKALQYLVVPMAILQRLYESLNSCKVAVPGEAGNVRGIDQAWALIVGSIEGDEKGGYPGGQGLYALSKVQCNGFDTCNAREGAKANDLLLAHFLDAQIHMGNHDCVELEHDISKISSILMTPLIQGAIRYAIVNELHEAGEESGDLGSAYVFAQTHIPLIKATNPEAYEILERNFDFDRSKDPIADGAKRIFETYQEVIPQLKVNCDLVGIVGGMGSLCGDEDGTGNDEGNTTEATDEESNQGETTEGESDNTEQQETTGGDGSSAGNATLLGGGLFVATKNVTDRAYLGEDQKSMIQALQASDEAKAREIYEKGGNSRITDGSEAGKFRSFQSLSTEAHHEMTNQTIFTFFDYALRDKFGNFESAISNQYADTFVQGVFSRSTLAAEAVVALHLWMYTVHKLENSLRDCHDAGSINEDEVRQELLDDSMLSIDEAAAYYIGSGQEKGSPDGALLYALAEKMAIEFEKEENGQAQANAAVLKLMNEAKTHLTFADSCSDGSSTYERLRLVVDKIRAKMTIPLMQSLIKYLQENDKDRVKLYAISIVPQIVGCSPSAFGYLKEQLIENEYDMANFDEILSTLRSTYSCLKISCDDVGAYKSVVPACTRPEPLRPFAGYKPSTEVLDHAKVDLDIHQIHILMKMHATQAALDIYLYGRNSMQGVTEYRTLQSLATKSTRSVVPQYELYKKYFQDADYADTLIVDMLKQRGMSRFATASTQQKTEVVDKVLKFQVMHMYLLRVLYDSVEDCYSGDPLRNAGSTVAWDEAAAFFVGSMEGGEIGGHKSDGQLLYAQYKTRCREFRTCNAEGLDSHLNEEIMSILIAGKEDILNGKCSELKEKAQMVDRIVTTGNAQATLAYVLENEALNVGSLEGSLAAGDIVYGSIGPLVRVADSQADRLVSRNLGFQLTYSPVAEGSKAVFAALGEALPEMGVDCSKIGTAPNGLTACPEGVGHVRSAAVPLIPARPAAAILAMVCVATCLFM